MDRVILHCDLNNFFASVSLLYNQTLKNMPVAVCGRVEDRHGIVLAKNEIAKGFGVKTAEPVWEAQRKCSELCILPPLYEKYEFYSREVKKIYRRYTDKIEPFGIDECWLDVTGSTFLFGSGEEIAECIRKAVKEELGLTISVGVSFNKVFAKLGSDMKKPDAVTLITRENFKEKVWNLPVEDLLFIGRSTAKKLRSLSIFKIGDIALCEKETLKALLGKNGETIYNYVMGLDISEVVAEEKAPPPKSIGKSETPSKDYTTDEAVWVALLSYSQDIAEQLRRHRLYAKGVQISVRTPDLKTREYSLSLDSPTDSGLILAKWGMELYIKNKPNTCRSVGIRAINLTNSLNFVQTDMFENFSLCSKQEEIERKLSEINNRFGKNSVLRASILLQGRL